MFFDRDGFFYLEVKRPKYLILIRKRHTNNNHLGLQQIFSWWVHNHLPKYFRLLDRNVWLLDRFYQNFSKQKHSNKNKVREKW